MKILAYLIFFIAAFNCYSSQNKITVLEKSNNKPMYLVIVHFKALEGTSKDSIVALRTNRIGEVNIPFKSKMYAHFYKMGYESLVDTLLPNDDKTIYLNELSFHTDEVVVTGQYTPASINKSVHPIKIIGEQRIQQQAASSLKDLLMTEANIKIQQDNILGSDLKINGISGSNVKILIDGVPVIGRLNGSIDLNQINLSNVHRIEIIDGPMSSVYGSDALGGVINIISKEPDCPRLEADGNGYWESVGTYNFDLTTRYSISDFNLQLNGGRNLFQGYDEDNSKRDKQWNPKEQYFANFQAVYGGEDFKIRYSGQLFDEYILNRGTPRAPYNESAFDDKYKTLRLTNSLFANGRIGNSSAFELTGAYSYYKRKKNTYLKDLTTLNEQLSEALGSQDTSVFDSYMFRATYSDDKLLENLKYQLGFDFNNETAEGHKIKNTKQSISDIAGFLSLQYLPITSLTIQPSLRVIKNSKYDAPIIPALNLRWQTTDNLFLRLAYSAGFRSPALKELYLEFVDINHNIHGNENLKAEESQSINLSATYSSTNEDFHYKIEPKFFYNKIDNLITLAEVSSGVYNNINIGQYETIGGNFTLSFIAANISINTVFGITGTLNDLHSETGTNKYNFANELSLNADYLIPFIDTRINVFYKYTGQVPAFAMIDNAAYEYFIEDYNMLDINLSKTFCYHFDVQLGVKNLFDVNNITSSTVNSGATGHTVGGNSMPISWGRTFFTKLGIRI